MIAVSIDAAGAPPVQGEKHDISCRPHRRWNRRPQWTMEAVVLSPCPLAVRGGVIGDGYGSRELELRQPVLRTARLAGSVAPMRDPSWTCAESQIAAFVDNHDARILPPCSPPASSPWH